MNDTKLYYNAGTRQIYIDERSKTTVLDVPSELSNQQALEFIQSGALYSIIKQLTS